MPEKKKQVLETLEKLIPKMSDNEADRLIAFTEGMAFMKDQAEESESIRAALAGGPSGV